jgi:DNA helicase-2/ATP-dependent DNA helicase PcrA
MNSLSASVNDLRDNSEQWAALTTEGHCVVLAPPGSGKTKLLTTRVAVDLANKISEPQGAACMTMTNPAAGELRERLSALGRGRRESLFIGTVHSFVLSKVVLPFAAYVGRPELMQISIASTADSGRAFREAINAIAGHGADHRLIKSTVEHHRKRLSPPESWERSGEVIVKVAARYLEILHNQGLIDFDELIGIGVHFVENHQLVRQVLNARYPHFYVDEYQDLAPGLDRLIKALCFDYRTGSQLFAVGDPDQALFAFTGTRPELLIELANRGDVTPINLRRNYRCGEEIVRVAQLVKHGQSPVVADRAGGSVTTELCPDGFAQQCSRSAERIAAARQRGVALHEIVLLATTNELCGTALIALREAGVPAYFRNTDDYRLTACTALVEGCAAWACRGRETSNYRLGSLLRQWRSIHGAAHTREQDAALTQLLLNHQTRGELPAYVFLDALLDLGLGAALQRPELADDAVQIAAMHAALTTTGRLNGLTIDGLAARALKTDRVEVTTMTSSKGLEFDIAIILGADQGRIPFYKASAEQIAEDRRKFYVSLTRARHEVHIYYSGFVEWASGNIGRNGPSMFLRETRLL